MPKRNLASRSRCLKENRCVGGWASAGDGVHLDEIVAIASGCALDKTEEAVGHVLVLLEFVGTNLCSATAAEIVTLRTIYIAIWNGDGNGDGNGHGQPTNIGLGTCHLEMSISPITGFMARVD
jgi:hypothetical protein